MQMVIAWLQWLFGDAKPRKCCIWRMCGASSWMYKQPKARLLPQKGKGAENPQKKKGGPKIFFFLGGGPLSPSKNRGAELGGKKGKGGGGGPGPGGLFPAERVAFSFRKKAKTDP